ncbi:ABATE domain-containing protein [Amycolatopsis sp. NPDC089917]|uniref:CGNR zinc finger domain-containing protein n=1 Tax=Amycolatopsis sp. NPDC089917 TaxID=3155187 RepID=UPI0034147265
MLVLTYLSGCPCLDLTATLQLRHRVNPRELLKTPADVTRWLAQAGLAMEVAADEDGLGRTIALREAIYRSSRGDGGVDDRAFLNAVAAFPPLVPYWTAAGVENLGDLWQAHSTLAREAISLLNGPHAARIRECEYPECSRLFCDLSHGGRRRWCGIGICATKATSTAYRRRKKQGITTLRQRVPESEDIGAIEN